MVEIKRLDRHSADFCFAHKSVVVPLKMVGPNFRSRIEECNRGDA